MGQQDGRYLYRLPRQRVDWDAQKRQFVRVPTLPPEALLPVKPKQPVLVNGAQRGRVTV